MPLDIENAIRLYHLAGQHQKAGRADQAISLYRELLRMEPRHLAAMAALEILLEEQGSKEAARTINRRRTRVEARNAYAIGKALAEEGQHDRAVPFFERAIGLKPDYLKAIWRLGETFSHLKQVPDALRCYQRCLELNPNDVEAHFMIATFGGEAAPVCAPEVYVRNYFDNYAESFDEHLCESLDYRGPEILFAHARGFLGQEEARFDILDIGCGTGLVGQKFHGLARSLTGVDLSPEMIARAKACGLYDSLHIAEAVAFLTQAPPGRYDLLLACDSLVYIGDLEPLMAAATQALRSGGFFILSLEKSDAPGFALQTSGRYAHHPDYLPKLMTDRFCIRAADEAVLRREFGTPVVERVYVLEKL